MTLFKRLATPAVWDDNVSPSASLVQELITKPFLVLRLNPSEVSNLIPLFFIWQHRYVKRYLVLETLKSSLHLLNEFSSKIIFIGFETMQDHMGGRTILQQ